MEPGTIHGREDTSEVNIEMHFFLAIKDGASQFGGFCGRHSYDDAQEEKWVLEIIFHRQFNNVNYENLKIHNNFEYFFKINFRFVFQ